MSELSVFQPPFRKILEGVASRQQTYALFNRHSQAPFDEKRMTGSQYAGEWFEVTERDHDRMFEILPPLLYRGDMFAMREFIGANITSVFFTLTIGGRERWFHGYCDLATRHSGSPSDGRQSPDDMRAAILERENRADRTMTRQEKLDHIWSVTGADFRTYADARFPVAFRGRQMVIVFSASGAKLWKLLDDLSDAQIAAKLPVQLRRLPTAEAA
ncbi:hypothetical protein B5K05_33440 [Rhizobium phaseoli]|uniref:DUF1419 domain-containing protein n=1 Tax=Rhizobium phaseoli TaxID=396 RepID=UPI000E0D20D5|nr:DUF1419 domain-containing protein [Rhizobium phaseoli]RDJ00777.1 hypothetical protein B5K05_33440 [Rhizobium phaseoli]RDJ00976.1 hypothetical protein B5K04_31520 [Rhizobium phaseoli]